MKFLRAQETPRRRGDTVFKEARLGKLIVFVIFLLLTLGALLLGFSPETLPVRSRPPPFVAFFVAASLSLFALVCLYSFRASLLASNWLVRFDGSNIYVKYRSYLNHHFPAQDRVVVGIPAAEIEWIRNSRESRLIPRRHGDSSATTTHLDIKLRDADTSELERELAEERRREAPMVLRTRSKARHYPVRVLEPGIVRIDWRDHRTRITPSIGAAIRILGRRIPVEREESFAQVPAETLNHADQETRLLDMIERGEMLAAVRLAQRLYGFSTSEAKAFVDGLAE
jgi:hypothetical protein